MDTGPLLSSVAVGRKICTLHDVMEIFNGKPELYVMESCRLPNANGRSRISASNSIFLKWDVVAGGYLCKFDTVQFSKYLSANNRNTF
jgi:hypothetical protein